MKTFLKVAGVIGVAGIVALAATTPSQARNGRNAAAIGGFAAGAVVGAAVANSNNNAYYGPGYGYEPGYAYEPAYADDYAYAPAPAYRGSYYSGTSPYDSRYNNTGGIADRSR